MGPRQEPEPGTRPAPWRWKRPPTPRPKGSYNSASEIVKLFKGQTNPQTAIHEILHHSERLMPEPVQQGIRRAWGRATKDLMAKATPERRAAMEALDQGLRW